MKKWFFNRKGLRWIQGQAAHLEGQQGLRGKIQKNGPSDKEGGVRPGHEGTKDRPGRTVEELDHRGRTAPGRPGARAHSRAPLRGQGERTRRFSVVPSCGFVFTSLCCPDSRTYRSIRTLPFRLLLGLRKPHIVKCLFSHMKTKFKC